MAVVAAPNRAMSERTETWPMYVAMASKINTPYTYLCCTKHMIFSAQRRNVEMEERKYSYIEKERGNFYLST